MTTSINVEEKICSFCGKLFLRNTKPRTVRNSKGGRIVRSMGTVTCSPKCSREYTRDYKNRNRNFHNEYLMKKKNREMLLLEKDREVLNTK